MSRTIPRKHTLRVLFVRHGQTENNEGGIVQGTFDTPLSALGLQQAQEAAVWLEELPITHCYTSDLERAANTAEIIIGHNHKDVMVKRDMRLQEQYMGVLQGNKWRNFEDLRVSVEEYASLEAQEPLDERIGSFWGDLVVMHGEEPFAVKGTLPKGWWCGTPPFPICETADTVLVVTHGGVIHAITQLLLAGQRPVKEDSAIVPAGTPTDGSVKQDDDTKEVEGLIFCEGCTWPADAKERAQTPYYTVPNCSVTEIKITFESIDDISNEDSDSDSDSDVDAGRYHDLPEEYRDEENRTPSKPEDKATKASIKAEVVCLGLLPPTPVIQYGAATTVRLPEGEL